MKIKKSLWGARGDSCVKMKIDKWSSPDAMTFSVHWRWHLHSPLHEPLVFGGGIGLRQEVLSHQGLEIHRRVDARRL